MLLGFFISLGFKGGRNKTPKPSASWNGGGAGGGSQQSSRITESFILSHYDGSTGTLDFSSVRLRESEIDELSASAFLPTAVGGKIKFTDSGYRYASGNATVVANFAAKGFEVVPNRGILGQSKLGDFILG